MLRNIGTKQENAFSGKVQPTLACLWISQTTQTEVKSKYFHKLQGEKKASI